MTPARAANPNATATFMFQSRSHEPYAHQCEGDRKLENQAFRYASEIGV